VIPDLFKMWEFWTFLTAFVFSQGFWTWVTCRSEPPRWSWSCACGGTVSWTGDAAPDVVIAPFAERHARCHLR
jgi:hypothetical protein